ncbi:type VI secretion system amidase effector protein Tae4 [Burkholderia sp. Bp8998]|uniref:type VI secretion system amidase effector protein Tae4 n=1 Tax=Burkholderia sp. Bp8998 TaxID=2184557 RepID=UPI0021AB58AE|nr:type VI secretion system amidase effector protein Tae4 [Burkholderia sp. Bp8998]
MGSSNANLRPDKLCGESCSDDWRQCGHQYQQQGPEVTLGEYCAVRLSYILGQAGMPIPYILGQTVSGADKRWYFFRVKNLIDFLEQRWGKAEVIRFPPPRGGNALTNRQGIILFEVSGWSNATGHATLFNGSTCCDQCYFNEPGTNYRTDRAHFWSLP